MMGSGDHLAKFEIVSQKIVCPYHQMYPNAGPTPYCTCSQIVTTVRQDGGPADYLAARERQHEDSILREADVIRARRAGAI